MKTPGSAPGFAHGNVQQDWQLEKSLSDCNRHMLENQLECDITFTFLPPEGTAQQAPSISAHKYMLISRSPVFWAMLAGPAKEKSGTIRIEDIDRESFQEMLR